MVKIIVTGLSCILYTILCVYFGYLIHKNWNKYTTKYCVLDTALCVLFFIIDIVLFIIPLIGMIMGC